MAELNVAIEGVDVDIVAKTTTTALITCDLSNTPLSGVAGGNG